MTKCYELCKTFWRERVLLNEQKQFYKMPGIYLILILVMGASWFVSYRLKSKFRQYSEVGLNSGLSGKEIAEKMLADHGISDVQVISVEGFLSDHYNPLKKTVNLSPEVYNGRSVAAAAVAAHECGHAVQHARSYAWLQMRSALVPVVQFSSGIVQWILLIGVLLIATFPYLLLAGIVMFAFTTLFAFITLPVEFDASIRALVWLENTRLTYGEEHTKAKDALNWAAMTYVVAAIGSLATLLYYVSIFMGRRD
jgi:Zn-dependent membrane protease YugP